MQDNWTSLTVDNGKAGLVVMPDEILLGRGDSGLNLASASVTLKGGGSEIKLANNSVTIGELKITQVGGKTKLSLLDQSEEKIAKLEKKFETLQRALSQSIEDKDKEIVALKEQLSNLGNASKSKKKKK
jgi:vacuolar-type H+-ATPase subunit I/STV1